VSGVLTRKVFRDLARSGWQYASIALMVALGVAFLIGAYSVYECLKFSYAGSYERLAFEDFSIRFHSAPPRVAQEVARLPGVKAVEGRLVEETALEIEGKSGAQMVGRIIAIPTKRPLRLNRLHLVSGRELRSGTSREVLLESNFAKYHKLSPGVRVIAVRGRSRLPLRVAGVVQSDEYLYVVRSKQDLISMPDTFGVLFMDEEAMGTLFGEPGTINEIHATVTRPELRAAAMRSAARLLRRYDPEAPVPREEQPSYQMLAQDVQGFRSYAVLFPLLFLGVAAVSVYSMLMRAVFAQRPVIGLFRSLGLSKGQVVRHYLGGTLVIGALASLAGCALGLWVGDALSRYYMTQVEVPFPDFRVRWGVTIVGFIVGTATCVLAGWVPARRAAGIRPAEAMRPVTPAFGRRSVRIDAVLPGLSTLGRIPFRNVFRQPRRTLSTLIGVVSGMCLMITATGLLNSMDVAIEELVGTSFGYDVRADFYEYQSRRVVASVRSWPGVLWAEGELELPVDIRHGGITYSALLNGLEPGTRLRKLKDDRGNAIALPSQGAIFGPTIKSRLGLRLGDRVEIALPEPLTPEKSTWRTVAVAGFNDEAIGTQAYMLRSEVERLFRRDLDLPANAITSVLVKTAPGDVPQVRKKLLDLPYAGSALAMETTRKMVQDLVKQMNLYVSIMELFGVALAFATVFNMITVNVLERQAEIATLRTLGVGRGQIGRLVAVENFAVALIGILLGLPISNGFVHLFWRASMSEAQDLFTFDVVILPETYVRAAALILIVAALSLVPSLRVVQRLDLARAVKERST